MKNFLPTSKGYSSNNLRITAAGFNITLQNILTAPDSFILFPWMQDIQNQIMHHKKYIMIFFPWYYRYLYKALDSSAFTLQTSFPSV